MDLLSPYSTSPAVGGGEPAVGGEPVVAGQPAGGAGEGAGAALLKAVHLHCAVLQLLGDADSLIQAFRISDDLTKNRIHLSGIRQLLASARNALELLQWMNRLAYDLLHFYMNVDTRADRLAYDIRTKELELRPILEQLG